MVGSLLMLVAIIYMMFLTQEAFGQMTSNLLTFYKLDIPFIGGDFFSPQTLMFFAFALAFAIKVPLFPLHTWLPDAHVEAPTGGSVVLAAITLKLGAYGFLRFILPIVPDASHMLAPFVVTISLIAIVYIGFVALVQTDM